LIVPRPGSVPLRLGAALLAACAGPERVGPVAISVNLDRASPGFGVVRVEGVSAEPGAAARVYVGDSLAGGAPPLAGEWRRRSGGLDFVPRFPPSAGVTLWVRVDTAALAGRAAGEPVVRRFTVPAAGGDSPPTALAAIHPAAATLPENLLRFYLEFSAPMRPGQALDHVRLLDRSGAEVRGAFLEVSEELWDPSGRRLTLLFDPGRVKQGIRTNLEAGRALVAGRRYRLRIDAAWRDASGRPLAAPAEKAFVATAADHEGPDPARWEIAPPAAGSAAPLEVRFDEPLDHALAARLIAVEDESGRPVAGGPAVDTLGLAWRFTPASVWVGGAYRLRVSPELEDLAGNRPGRAFDTDVTRAAADPIPTLTRRFVVR
jgi:hypothetical protein